MVTNLENDSNFFLVSTAHFGVQTSLHLWNLSLFPFSRYSEVGVLFYG